MILWFRLVSTVRADIGISLETHQGVTEISKPGGEGLLEGIGATTRSVILQTIVKYGSDNEIHEAKDLPDSLERAELQRKGKGQQAKAEDAKEN